MKTFTPTHRILITPTGGLGLRPSHEPHEEDAAVDRGNWRYMMDGELWLAHPECVTVLGPLRSPVEMAGNGTKDTNPKDAVGSRKIPWHIIPWRVMAGVCLAFFGGALKYRAFNYRIAGVRASVYIDAAIRHILRFAEGEDHDPDVKGYNAAEPSKGVLVHHLDEAIAGLMVLRDSMLLGNWTDDRAPAINPGWIDEANEMAGRIIDANPNPKADFTQYEVAKTRAVAAGLAAFVPEGTDATWLEEIKNTGEPPASSPPAPIAPAGVDTPVETPPAPFMAIHDTEPGDLPVIVDREAIPEGVTYNFIRNTFFRGDKDCDDEGGPMAFYNHWFPRASEFPPHPSEEL
jgi:hypothetical protein